MCPPSNDRDDHSLDHISLQGNEAPVAFRLDDMPDTRLSPEQSREFSREIARRNPELYSTPEEIRAATVARYLRLGMSPEEAKRQMESHDL